MKLFLTFITLIFALMHPTISASEILNSNLKKNTLALNTPSNNFLLSLKGFLQYDLGFVSSDENNFESENNLRRAKLDIRTTFNNTWSGRLDFEFSNSETELRDVTISYIGLENFVFSLGNQRPHFSLDELSSSRWTTFLERSMVSNVSRSGRRVGINSRYANKSVSVGVSVFGDSVDISNSSVESEDGNTGVSEKYSYSLRALYRPYLNQDKSTLLHVGINYLYLKPESDANSTERLRARIENSILDLRPLNTGFISNVEERIAQGVELVAKYNKYSVKGEYIKSTINRTSDNTDVNTDGFYIEAAYSIWGQGKNYKTSSGLFGAVKPNSKKGELEVALRYSTLDLNDTSANISGGRANNVTFALNWYIDNYVSIKLNHTISSLDNNANADGDINSNNDVNVTAARLQLSF